jgi:hypothetical protein
MNCPEKEGLQHNCAEAWNVYASAVDELGFPQIIDPISKVLTASAVGVFRLRWEHLKASHALSEHLCTHRC